MYHSAEMRVKMIKKRSEIEKEYTWATEDLYANDTVWETHFQEVEKFPAEVAAYQGRLGESAQVLLDYFQLGDKIVEELDRLAAYAFRKMDEDTKISRYQAMAGRVQSLLVTINSAMSFAEPELLAIPEETLQRFYQESEELRLYELEITRVRKRKDHILSEQEERILAMSNEIGAVPADVFKMFNNADLTFPSIHNEEGKEVPVTHGTYISYLESKDRRVRKDAFEAMYSVYSQFQNTAAAMLDGQVRQLYFQATAKNYESTLHAALDETEVPVKVYHNLIQTVHENIKYMHRYVRLRKKLLGYDELHMYDLYTPVVEKADLKIPFEKAKEEIYEALAPLGKQYQEILKYGLEHRWIDVYENEGKRSGAYSAGAKVHPFVLLNYSDNLDSEFTLAHEMGHALHSYLSNKNQPTVYAQYKIFVAEVASTCNEALLMRYLLNKTEDKKEKAYLINHFLDGFKGTLFRQAMFAEFELEINQMVARGEKLTAERLNAFYHELNTTYYGSDIVVDDYIDVEWSKIPHFYMNFYVYQYATGYSAAIALSDKILKEGEPAVKNYLDFLSSGGSSDPVSLLKKAGVDMSSSEPIQDALKVFGGLIDEMEHLLEEI